MELIELFIKVVDDGVSCGDLTFPKFHSSPGAAKAILELNGRNPARAKRAAFRAFHLGKECPPRLRREPWGEGRGHTGNSIPHAMKEEFKMTRQGKP
jgi:hypothetical protein